MLFRRLTRRPATLQPALLVALTLLAGGPPATQPDTAAADDDGWVVLFDGTPESLAANFDSKPDRWHVDDGAIAWRKGCGFLWSKRRFADFVLEVDFKVSPKCNSGVFLRTHSRKDWLHTGIEVQVLDGGKHNEKGLAAVYDIQAANDNLADAVKPTGEWNTYRITADGPDLTVELNGVVVNGLDLDRWTEPGRNPDGGKNKFRYAYADLIREGFIGFQDHGKPVWFRQIRVKPLGDREAQYTGDEPFKTRSQAEQAAASGD